MNKPVVYSGDVFYVNFGEIYILNPKATYKPGEFDENFVYLILIDYDIEDSDSDSDSKSSLKTLFVHKHYIELDSLHVSWLLEDCDGESKIPTFIVKDIDEIRS